MKKTYTKPQLKAIEGLLLDLDELENKPRRLFYALEELAIAFDKVDAVPSIREAQDLIYSHINEGEQYEELFRSLRQFKIDEWAWQIKNSPSDTKFTELSIKGAETFIRKHVQRLTERRFF